MSDHDHDNNNPNEQIKELKTNLKSVTTKYKSYKEKYLTEKKTCSDIKDKLDEKNESYDKLLKQYNELKNTSSKGFDKDTNKNKKSEGKFSSSKSMGMNNQYDMIIKIDSLVASNKRGWQISYKDKQKIEKWSKKEQIALGVIGRENIGKTWIINKLANENFPSGYYCNTEGLSIKYCSDENDQLKVLLDSAGMNGAIYFYNIEELEKYLSGTGKDPTKITKEEFQRLRETMINDRSMTEYFIQNFILYACNIIIIVVELLTQHDQKIIERIKSLYSETKNIIVVHNFFKLELKEHVLQRSTFEIKGAFSVTEMKIPMTGVPFYVEKSEKKTNNNIIHVILGKEGSESGNYFNEATLKHISKAVDVDVQINRFNLLEKLNNYWKEKHAIYFNIFRDEKNLPFFSEKFENDKTSFKLEYPKDLSLKTPEFSVLGALKDLDIIYHLFVINKPQREKIYYFELPGISQKPEITLINEKQTLLLKIKEGFDIPENANYVEGEDKKNFVKKIQIKDQHGNYDCDKSFTKLENGLLKMRFILSNSEEDL